MLLGPGAGLGPYEILSAIGAGGMGEVYRARDTRLKREVALKILPATFATDPGRLARFQREAEVLATLNHPNIAAIYGLEGGPTEAGPYVTERAEPTVGGGFRRPMQALVMELVEGETLAERIARGAIPVADAVSVAKQMAEALEAAHERGIIHRDLKPANIKVRSDGTVKVLDFGLAKLTDPNDPNDPTDPTVANRFSISPTITSPALMTGVGVLLGTAAYMSPEQAKGRPADKRSDIWAFGCVLYEMLTGQRAFPGDDVSETLAGVIKSEPDWDAVPNNTPASIRRLLRRCLQKDPRRRLRDAGDARIELEEPPDAQQIAVGPSRLWRGRAAIALAVLVATIAVAIRFLSAPPSAPAVVFDVGPPPGGRIDIGEPLSPDGRMVAFIAAGETGPSQIWVRPLDSTTPRLIPGTEQAQRPFWSPDSQWIGYFAQGKLAKVQISGGPPLVIANEGSRDGAWSPEDVILVGGQRGKPLLRVSAGGGQATPVTELRANEISHDYPDFLPDGRHFLFMARGTTLAEAALYVGSLDSKDRHLLSGINSGARYSPTGHVLFVRDNTLMAQTFDVRRFELSGSPFPVARDVPGPVAPFSTSSNGALAYLSGATASNSELTWFDRTGKPLGRVASRGAYSMQALSPDDNYVAFSNAAADIWVLDIGKGVASRVTSDPASDFFPVWSPDGRRIAFSSNRGGTSNLYERTFGVVGEDKLLLKSNGPDANARDWSPDGNYLLYNAAGDIWALPMAGNEKPMRVTETSFAELNPVLSPDARWMAYSTDETGEDQIYIQSFPQPGVRQQVSGTGGFQPRWSRDGKELFYIRPDFMLMSVSVKALDARLDVSAPVPLFRKQLAVLGPIATQRSYSVSADGRFLMNVSPDDLARPITVVLNWASTLKK
jgi:eukaryotic-like serine/threonine-protein kinase